MNARMYYCMRLLKSKIILLFVSLILLSACDEKPPIPEKKFLDLYVDLLIIQDTTTAANFSIDSVKTVVLDRYDISNEQYDSMIKFYNSNPEKWITFFDSATAYVERLKPEAENQP
jgi:hypothetical protein